MKFEVDEWVDGVGGYIGIMVSPCHTEPLHLL